MTKVFITGATGYIGGDVLYAVANTYLDLEITALVRNSDKGAQVAAQYPKIRLVYGDLDSSDLLTTESANANIVLHCADCDHVGAATAIVAGMSKSSIPGPSYLIHTSGTGVLSWANFEENTFGYHRAHTYNDWDGIKEVTSLPDAALHRNVDKIVLAASKGAGEVKTAIVCPPCIYGPGRGPGNKASMQAYFYSAATLKRGKGFILNEGANVWTESHVRDLSNLFLALVTAALEPNGGKATWNDEGYYFSGTGEFVFGDVGKAIAKIAHEKKLINTSEVDSITTEEADKLVPMGTYLWGTNSRGTAIRAGKVLGWKPQEKSLFDVLPDIVDHEARKQGLIKGHAVKAAGDA
ncbi:hypothetical protein E8E13_000272 [Curvularia kusanoi]|uniref:NAD(P)-binding domain-containing protein n=1 Tax=Curvularia kusanoi TaxID=90978 RepID=A0A9P4W210_CURKU|nr:hypothetical protein E8E13_000272 [Curvularia kusanoi]